jgi:cobalt-zinc-cadmium efflux system outer membrane protein
VELLHALAEETRSYERDIVPASAQALDAMSLGFREGKFGFLEVLDAQRSLFEATVLLLDSRQRYAVAHAELERLLGRRLGADGGAQSAGSGSGVPGQGVQR